MEDFARKKALKIITKLETKFLWEKSNVIRKCVLVGITTNVYEGNELNNNLIYECEVSPLETMPHVSIIYLLGPLWEINQC